MNKKISVDIKKVLISGVLQSPPITLFYLLMEKAVEQPLLAILLLVTYELVILFLVFSKKIWKKVFTEHYEGILIKTCSEWIINTIDSLINSVKIKLSPFRKHYKKELMFEHRQLNVRGIKTNGTYKLEVESIFVELKIIPSQTPNKSYIDLLSTTYAKEAEPIWSFLRRRKNKKEIAPVLVVLGSPGCGKTTLLQHMTLVLAHNQQGQFRLPAYIPVFLFLREHILSIIQDSSDLADLIHDHFSKPKHNNSLKPPAGWFRKQMQKGNCLIMLDGLDEVANKEERLKISEWLDMQIKEYRYCPFIITSRPKGYQDAPLEKISVILEVQPFTYSQVQQFVHSWYLASELVATGKNDLGVHSVAKQNSEDFLMRLNELPALYELTVNPLLLTMMTTVHLYRGELPGRRVELYDEICNVLLGHWSKAKKLKDPLTALQKKVVLQPLAAYMMQKNLRDIKRSEALSVIEPFLRTVGLQKQEIESFLEDNQESSGLFVEREIGLWSFTHLSFQEYLAATHFFREQITLDFLKLINKSWWQETLRLYSAQGGATILLKACLENDSVKSLTLASECLNEALTVEESVREEVTSRILENLSSKDKFRFQLAAEVLLNLRLNNLSPIGDDKSIDKRYITNAEYQLFVNEMAAIGKSFQPLHWKNINFKEGESLYPVLGVLPDDATSFCNWLTGNNPNFIYRVPYGNEIQHETSTVESLLSHFNLNKAKDNFMENKNIGCWFEEKNESIFKIDNPSLNDDIVQPLNIEKNKIEYLSEVIKKSVINIANYRKEKSLYSYIIAVFISVLCTTILISIYYYHQVISKEVMEAITWMLITILLVSVTSLINDTEPEKTHRISSKDYLSSRNIIFYFIFLLNFISLKKIPHINNIYYEYNKHFYKTSVEIRKNSRSGFFSYFKEGKYDTANFILKNLNEDDQIAEKLLSVSCVLNFLQNKNMLERSNFLTENLDEMILSLNNLFVKSAILSKKIKKDNEDISLMIRWLELTKNRIEGISKPLEGIKIVRVINDTK